MSAGPSAAYELLPSANPLNTPRSQRPFGSHDTCGCSHWHNFSANACLAVKKPRHFTRYILGACCLLRPVKVDHQVSVSQYHW